MLHTTIGNSGITSYFSMKPYIVTSLWNLLEEIVPIRVQNTIFFHGEIYKIIHKVSLLPLPIWSTVGHF